MHDAHGTQNRCLLLTATASSLDTRMHASRNLWWECLCQSESSTQYWHGAPGRSRAQRGAARRMRVSQQQSSRQAATGMVARQGRGVQGKIRGRHHGAVSDQRRSNLCSMLAYCWALAGLARRQKESIDWESRLLHGVHRDSYLPISPRPAALPAPRRPQSAAAAGRRWCCRRQRPRLPRACGGAPTRSSRSRRCRREASRAWGGAQPAYAGHA